jgi:hypothetical protein
MQAPVLALGEPYELGLSGPARVLKRTKPSAETSFDRICPLNTHLRTTPPAAGGFVRFGGMLA